MLLLVVHWFSLSVGAVQAYLVHVTIWHPDLLVNFLTSCSGPPCIHEDASPFHEQLRLREVAFSLFDRWDVPIAGSRFQDDDPAERHTVYRNEVFDGCLPAEGCKLQLFFLQCCVAVQYCRAAQLDLAGLEGTVSARVICAGRFRRRDLMSGLLRDGIGCPEECAMVLQPQAQRGACKRCGAQWKTQLGCSP